MARTNKYPVVVGTRLSEKTAREVLLLAQSLGVYPGELVRHIVQHADFNEVAQSWEKTGEKRVRKGFYACTDTRA